MADSPNAGSAPTSEAAPGSEKLAAVEARMRDLLQKTAKREEVFGKEAFLEMPSSLQNELAVLQKQSMPKARTVEAVMAAESNLREYNAKLDNAFNLKQQLVGERGRRAKARKRELTRGVVQVLVVAAVVGGAVYFYREAAAEKATECREQEGCVAEGKCSGKLSFDPMGMVCAAQGQDCQGSTLCSKQGMCTAVQGACMARTADDCAASLQCKNLGQCSPFGGTCVAGSSDDCKASVVCEKSGACLEVGGRCITPAGFEQPSASASTSAGVAPKRPKRVKPRPRLRAHP